MVRIYKCPFNGNPVDEGYGFDNDADAWTGSESYGYYIPGQTCSDWTMTSGVGTSTETDIGYYIFRVETDKVCTTTYAVQCIKVED